MVSVRFLGGVLDSQTRQVELLAGCLPKHIHAPAEDVNLEAVMSVYEYLDRYDLDAGAYLYVYSGPWRPPSGV